MLNKEKWSIKETALSCFSSGYHFKEQDVIISQIIFSDGKYIRRDFCEKHKPNNSNEISTWKTYFSPPVKKQDIIKKEGIEGLLRNFIKSDPEANSEIIFILAVMLERKKILLERDTQVLDNGEKIRIYEHRKTSESFMIKDPELKLDAIENLKNEVAVLLGASVQSESNNNKLDPKQKSLSDIHLNQE